MIRKSPQKGISAFNVDVPKKRRFAMPSTLLVRDRDIGGGVKMDGKVRGVGCGKVDEE